MHHPDISKLHSDALVLDGEAFMHRVAGRRADAATANVAAQALRERAARIQNGSQGAIDLRERWKIIGRQQQAWFESYVRDAVPMSRRGQALAYKRDTPLQQLIIGASLIAFVLGACFGSAML